MIFYPLYRLVVLGLDWLSCTVRYNQRAPAHYYYLQRTSLTKFELIALLAAISLFRGYSVALISLDIDTPAFAITWRNYCPQTTCAMKIAVVAVKASASTKQILSRVLLSVCLAILRGLLNCSVAPAKILSRIALHAARGIKLCDLKTCFSSHFGDISSTALQSSNLYS